MYGGVVLSASNRYASALSFEYTIYLSINAYILMFEFTFYAFSSVNYILFTKKTENK